MTPRTFNNGYGGKQPGLSNMLVISLAVHLAVLTVIFVSLPTSSRRLTFGPVYSVQLVSQEAVLTSIQGSSLIKEIEKSSQAASSIIYKRQVTGLAPTPVKKDEINRSNIEKALSAIQQKQLNEPAASSPTKPVISAAASASKNSPGAVNTLTQEYIGVVWSRIQKNWILPPTLTPRDNIEATIGVRISRNGSLEFVNFEKRSGNRYFDDAALKAIKRSSPFPPFPARLTENSIEIGIRFSPSQFR